MPSIAHLVMGGIIGICLYYISDGKFSKTHVFILFLGNYVGPDVGWVLGVGRFSHSLLFYPLFAVGLAYVYRYFTRFTIKINGIKDIEIIDLENYKLQYINTYFLVLAGGIMHLYLDSIMNKQGEFRIIPQLPFNFEEYIWTLEDFVNFGYDGVIQIYFLISIVVGISLIFGFVFVFIWFLKKNSKTAGIIVILYLIIFLIFFYLAGSISTMFHPDGGAIIYVGIFWCTPIILCVLSTKDFSIPKEEKIEISVKDAKKGKRKLAIIIIWLLFWGLVTLTLSIFGIIFNKEILDRIFSNYGDSISEYFTYNEVYFLIIAVAIYHFTISLISFLCGVGLLFKNKRVWKFAVYYHLAFSWTIIGLVIACALNENSIKERIIY